MKKEPTTLPNGERLQELAAPLTVWYRHNARDLPWRREPEPYRVWVSEIMLQQTRVEAVKPYFTRFMQALPTVAALAQASDETLFKLWEGLGYYSRARNLRKAAQEVVARYGGSLPADFEKLLTLPGIGRYTAGAVASIAFGVPVPAVDGNVMRVVMRVLNCSQQIDLPQVRRAVEEALLPAMPQERPGDFNQALMELGATVCLPNGAPQCAVCPLAPQCAARQLGTAGALPARAEKRKRKIEQKTVLILLHGTGDQLCAALRRRPETGLLAGLWEFPHVDGWLEEDQLPALLQKWGLTPEELLEKRTAKHVFTHIEWEMQGYFLRVTPQAACPFQWAGKAAFEETYAVPSAFSAFSRALAAYWEEPAPVPPPAPCADSR